MAGLEPLQRNTSNKPVHSTASLSGIGHAVPNRIESSEEIEKRLGLDEGWIVKRTGISNRRIVEPEQATSDLAIQAARFALDDAAKNGHDIEASQLMGLVLATSTPDHLLPPTAPRIAMELGCGPIPAFDMAVACSGFVYGLTVAEGLTHSLGGPVLLIAANVLSKRINPRDAGTAALFADAAGAVICVPNQPERLKNPGTENGQIIASHLESDGSGWNQLLIPAGGSREPLDQAAIENQRHLMEIRAGRAVYRYAVESMVRCAKKAVSKAGLSLEQVDWWIPHQASGRVIEEFTRQIQAPPQRVVNVVEQYGNSSAATIPLACSLWNQQERLQPGQLIVFTAAGAGLTCGAIALRW